MPPVSARAGTPGGPALVGAIHVHSTYSHDGRDSLERLREFALERGIAFIGLTDHAEDLTADRFAEYVAHCARLSDDRVRLIPGLEYRFAGYTGLHLLALGLSRWITPATPAEFIRQTRDAARLTIVAHPVLARYQIPPEVAAEIHAVEFWNASSNTLYLPDVRSITLLRAIRRTRPGVVGVAGLDQHDSSRDRETRVVVSGDPADPLAALKAGRVGNVGRHFRFGAGVSLGPVPFAALVAARWAFDRVERAQHLVVTTLRRYGAA